MIEWRVFNTLRGIWKFDESDSYWTTQKKHLYFAFILGLLPTLCGMLVMEGIGVQWEVARNFLLLPGAVIGCWYVWRRFGKFELLDD